MAGLVLVATATIGILAYGAVERALYPAQLARMASKARILVERFAAAVDEAQADARLLAEAPAIAQVLQSRPGSAADTEATERLAGLFLAAAKPHYNQVRLIGADGMEIVRVDHSGVGGGARVVSESALQDKADRPYFAEAIGLPRDAVYVSPIELNQEHGAVEVPHLPVIRSAKPVYGPDDRPLGVVVINLDLRPAFERLRQSVDPGVEVYAVNEGGDYLVHPDRSREFGFDLGRPARLQEDYPGLDGILANAEQAPLSEPVVEDRAGGRYAATVVARRLGGDGRIAVVLLAPTATILAPAQALLTTTTAAGLVAILIAVLLAAALSRTIARPLGQMAAAVQRFDREQTAQLPTGGPMEIGLLADAFGRHIERERLFGAAVQDSSDAILTKSSDGVITAWNGAAARLYGYDADAAVGMPLRRLVPDDRLEEFAAIQEKLRGGQGSGGFETVRLNKAGQRLEVSVSVSPVRSPGGEVIGACEISRDVSVAKRADALFRLAVEACPAALIMTDDAGRILMANGEARETFGYDPDELIGKPVEMLVPERFREAHVRERQAFATRASRRVMGSGRELYGLRRDGTELPVEIGLNPLRTTDGPIVLSAIVDISERKRAEAEIATKTRELQRSNEELQQFAYVASHDLQEPLRMVSSFCELLKARYRDRLDADGVEFIDFAVDGAQRMRQLINDLLDYSRLETREAALSPVSSEEALEKASLNLTAAIQDCEARIRQEPLPLVLGNEVQLVRLFQNLIGNALKFRSADRPVVEISAIVDGADWVFSVKDNGIGMDPEFAEAVFGVFRRLHTREEYPGTGIGLAICKRIVERHGGRIWVEPAREKGTTVRFTLRASDQAPSRSAAAAGPAEPSIRQREDGNARQAG